MSKLPQENLDDEFAKRREEARIEVNKLDANTIHDKPERDQFFNTVYDRANDDVAQIPWADMAPKPQLINWLADNPGEEKTALDIACGLGDNAEAIRDHGYNTTAFDLSSSAIDWAKSRFPNSDVTYETANLFEPPPHWPAGFDLVHECYTLQALPPEMLDKTAKAIADLVAPGGVLLVYTRMRKDAARPDGPPWPLYEDDVMRFSALGMELRDDTRFEIARKIKSTGQTRIIPHQFAVWQKPR